MPDPIETPAAPITPPSDEPTPKPGGMAPEELAKVRQSFRRGVKDTTPVEEPPAPPAPAPDVKPPTDTPPPAPKDDVTPPTDPVIPPVEDKTDGKEPEIPKSITGKAADHFRAQSKELRDAKGENARLREEVKTLKAAPAPTVDNSELELTLSQLAKAQEELATYRRELSTVKLERTPEYKKAFGEPIKAAENQISAIAAAGGIAASEALAIADEPDANKRRERVKALVTDLDHMDQLDMRNAIETLATKKAESARVLSDSASALDLVEKNQKDQDEKRTKAQKEEFNRASETAFRTTFKKMAETNPLLKKLPADAPGATEWNAQVDKVLQMGIDLDRNPQMMADHSARADMIYKAIAFEIGVNAMIQYRTETDKKLADLTDENKNLQAAVDRYTQGTPPAGGGAPPADEPPEVDEKTDLSKRIGKRFSEITAPRR